MRTSDKTDQVMESIRKAGLTDPPRNTEGQVRGRRDYKYADLGDILEAVRPALSQVGVVILQDTLTVDGATSVATRLQHASSGQWVEAGPLGVPHTGDAQAVGSAITYGRRYQLLAILALASVDDDGTGASKTWERAQDAVERNVEAAAQPPGPERTERAAAPEPEQAAVGDGAGQPPVTPPPAAPTEDGVTYGQLRKATGSAALARELINRANDTDYNARTVVNVTDAELKLAWATLQEEGAA